VGRLEELRFPVFSSSVALRGTVKQSTGRVGEAVRLGTVLVEPGDTVVADVDGVIVLPAAAHDVAVAAAQQRANAEQGYLERLRAGEWTLDIYGLRDRVQTSESRS
jgi:4-hydroxy-4-methyl-2-oxoglutarate aldolase